MKNLYSLLTLMMSIVVFSQTKLIAYKSHSGNSGSFVSAVSANTFDTNFSNLGVAPIREVKDAKLDSVIIMDENKTILVTSSVCRNFRNNKETVWEPGRKAVYNHKLFSKKNIDSVKSVLKRDYYFKNDMDSVVFVEYDKQTKTYKELKPVQSKSENKPEKSQKGLLLGVLMFAGLSGIYNWKRNKKGHEK